MALGSKTGGRSKGTPNRKTLEVEEKLAEIGCDPIQAMAKIAAIAMAAGDHRLAGDLYKELAQYVAPKRKAVEHSGLGGGPIESEGLTDAQRASKATALLERVRKRAESLCAGTPHCVRPN
jgi:hypothetical protein